ncbi:MAG TPA: response regulator [Gemmatimonadales bacterium]|jgi:PleD family two-component response regulator|nr:response regulator [Gemmatimonadales bacterium]
MPPDAGSTAPQPLILLAHHEEWFARSLETVLVHGGYRVVRADHGEQALQRARSDRPDGIILDVALADPPGYGVCRALRADPAVSLATPIFMTIAGPTHRAEQIEALRAGAWELRGDPLDAEELMLRLAVYVHGKLEVDRVGAAGMVDEVSGLYNAAGMARRSEELASLTARQGLGMACVVFRPADNAADGALADRLAVAFKAAGRISDAIGRTGHSEFAVFAPATDAPAARRLVKRLSESVTRAINQPASALRAGFSAAPAIPPVSPGDLLARARTALA